MYDQEEATNRGALQGWTNCFSSSAGGDNVKISKYPNVEVKISKYAKMQMVQIVNGDNVKISKS